MTDHKRLQSYLYKKNVIVTNWWHKRNISDLPSIVMHMVNRKIDLKLNFFYEIQFSIRKILILIKGICFVWIYMFHRLNWNHC